MPKTDSKPRVRRSIPSSTVPVVTLHRRSEPLSRAELLRLALRLRDPLRLGPLGLASPAKLELGPPVREARQDVVRGHVPAVARAVHVPPVRGTQGHDVPRPEPPVLGLLEILKTTRSAVRSMIFRSYDSPSRLASSGV